MNFRDFVTLQRGFDLTKKNMVEGDVPVVGSTSIIGFHNTAKVDPPGVCTGRSGSLGVVQYLDQPFWPHNTSLWVKDFKGNDPRFVYYCLQSLDFGRFNAGAGVPTLNRNHLDTLEVNAPDLPTQRKIAGILSAYDDLIENNLRRIRILEEMAQSLYREWFIHFRFPGNEPSPPSPLPVGEGSSGKRSSSPSGRGGGEGRVKLVDSPLGPIPEGWEVKPVGECFEITGGGTPSKKVNEYWDEGSIQWYSPRDLTAAGTMFIEQSANQITELGLQKSSARMFPALSVMLTSRATIGAIAINTVPSCTNQGFITCLPNERVPMYFLFQWLHANVETFISHASGATFKEISKGVFRKLKFLQPAAALVQEYERFASPIGDELLNLQRRNQNLRQTRDLLLPKLLSPVSPAA